jgi:hypothetical protein
MKGLSRKRGCELTISIRAQQGCRHLATHHRDSPNA